MTARSRSTGSQRGYSPRYTENYTCRQGQGLLLDTDHFLTPKTPRSSAAALVARSETLEATKMTHPLGTICKCLTYYCCRLVLTALKSSSTSFVAYPFLITSQPPPASRGSPSSSSTCCSLVFWLYGSRRTCGRPWRYVFGPEEPAPLLHG